MKTLDDLDLSPIATTTIDLLGMIPPERWSPFGACYSSSVTNWTPELGARLRAATVEAEVAARRATKAQLIAWLERHGVTCFEGTLKRRLVSHVVIYVNEQKAPRVFINARKAG